jgi:hypothetical protein
MRMSTPKHPSEQPSAVLALLEALGHLDRAREAAAQIHAIALRVPDAGERVRACEDLYQDLTAKLTRVRSIIISLGAGDDAAQR